MIRLHILASGSKGNAAIVENGLTGEGVLIDCGICKRDFFERTDGAGFDVTKLRAVVVTHDHSDHTKNMGVVLRGLAKAGVVPVVHTSEAIYGASNPLREALASVKAPFQPFSAGDTLRLAGLQVRPFRTSHDAADSYGFRFDEAGEGDSLGYMTDTGIVTDEAWEALSGVNLLALESNHDSRMLEAGPYPYMLKQRIASDQGHLSNAQAAEALARLAHPQLRQVVAMHVSQENNTYRLPRETFEAIIAQAGLSTQVFVAFQDRLVTLG